MTDRHQELMDRAYDRWQSEDNNWSKQDFYDQLDAKERLAVFTGNFNYQVCNGGFGQWDGNGYASSEVIGYLQRLLKRIDTENSLKVLALLERFRRARETFKDYGEDDEAHEDYVDKLDDLDTAFYAINDQFLVEVEAELQG